MRPSGKFWPIHRERQRSIMARPFRARVVGFAVVVALAAVGGTVALVQSDPAPGSPTHDGAVAAPNPTSSTTGLPSGAGPVAAAGISPAGAAHAPVPTIGTTNTTGAAAKKAPVAGKVTRTTPGPVGAAASAQPGAGPDQPAGWRLLPGAPIGGRVGQSAVWTGREMVVWGGGANLDSDPLTDGAAFDPAARAWRKLPAAPLAPRFSPEMAWTGREVLIFGGTSVDGDILADAAAWDPASNTWHRLPAPPIGPRDGAVVAWAGDRLVVWGGATVPPDTGDGAAEDAPTSEMRADGAAYVPATDRWVPLASAPIPARTGAESVWTGSRLVISGGYHEGDDDDRADGAALDPVSGAWTPIAARPAPASCGGDSPCDGVWTGTMALFPTSGVRYDPAADRWSALAPYPSAASDLAGQPAVWTGRRLLAWGTPSDAGAADDTGDASATGTDDGGDGPLPPAAAGAYDPAADRWQPVPGGPLSSRVYHTAVWTGQEMLVWGGTAGDAGLADGASYRP